MSFPISAVTGTGSARVLPSREIIATKVENDAGTKHFMIDKLKTLLPELTLSAHRLTSGARSRILSQFCPALSTQKVSYRTMFWMTLLVLVNPGGPARFHKGPGDKKFLYWDPNIFDFCLYKLKHALRACLSSIRGLRPIIIPQVGLRPTIK